MNGRNPVLIVIFFLIVGIIVFYMMFKVRDADVSYSEQQSIERTEELTAALNELDYHIYWIGELPEYMDGIADHVTVIAPGAANSTNLPVAEGSVGFTNYDEDGQILEHIEQRDYAPYMMIVINTSRIIFIILAMKNITMNPTLIKITIYSISSISLMNSSLRLL